MKKHLIFIFSVVVILLSGSAQCFADNVTVALQGSPYAVGDTVYQNVLVSYAKGMNWTLTSNWSDLKFTNLDHPTESILIDSKAHAYDTVTSTDYLYNGSNVPITLLTGATAGLQTRVYRLGLQFNYGHRPGSYNNTVQFMIHSDSGDATGTLNINFPWPKYLNIAITDTNVDNIIDSAHSMIQGYTQNALSDMHLLIQANVPWTLNFRTTTTPNDLDAQMKVSTASNYVLSSLQTFTTFPMANLPIATGKRTVQGGSTTIDTALVDINSRITVPTGQITPSGDYPMQVIYELTGEDTVGD